MIIISQNQQKALEEVSRSHFIQRMEVHLRTHWRSIFADVTQTEIHEFIHEHWGIANSYGLMSELSVCDYINCVCALGADFRSTEFWALDVLEQDMDEDGKREQLNKLTLSTLEKSAKI